MDRSTFSGSRVLPPQHPAPLSGLSNSPAPLGFPTRLPVMAAPRPPASRGRDSAARLFGDYSYVKRDLRRIAALTLGALVILVLVSFLLPHWVR